MEDTFQNPIYNPREQTMIPEAPIRWNKVDPKFKNVLLIRAVISSVFMGAFAFFITQLVMDNIEVPLWVVFAILGLALVFNIIKAFIEYGRRQYIIRQHDVLSKRGFLSIRVTVMPFVRVQQVKIEEGVLSRMWGLASVHVSSASAGAGDVLVIAGLQKAHAEEVRKHVIQKINEENGAVV